MPSSAVCDVPGCDEGHDLTAMYPLSVRVLGRTLHGWACSPDHLCMLADAWSRWSARIAGTPVAGPPVEPAALVVGL